MNQPPNNHLCEPAAASRREFLDRTKHALAALAMASPLALAKKARAAAPKRGSQEILVYIYLRGGMDGMSAVVPFGDPDYYNLRPTLSLSPPGSGSNGVIDLDGFFGLNPVMSALMTPYNDGKLAFVHAAGSTNTTRSHFDAMKFMEYGTPDSSAVSVSSGFLSRHLMQTQGGATPVRGLSIDAQVPYAMYEAPDSIPVYDPAYFPFPGNPYTAPLRREMIEQMYVGAGDPVETAAFSGLAAIDVLDAIDFEGYIPSNGADYGVSSIGERLRKVATMIKAGVDTEAFTLDIDGWDTHDNQGNLIGTFADLTGSMSQALEAFYLDLDGFMDRVTVVALTEFGRTAAENGSSGTDHGRATCMMLMGGNVNGGQVHANWPGLAADKLDLGDLAVTTDYRDIVGEVLLKRLGTPDLDAVFPGHTYTDLGLIT